MSRCEDDVAVSIVVVGGDVITSAEDDDVFVTATNTAHTFTHDNYQTIFITQKSGNGTGFDAFPEISVIL